MRSGGVTSLNLFSLIINNKSFILQPPPEGGLTKAFLCCIFAVAIALSFIAKLKSVSYGLKTNRTRYR